MQLRKLGHDWLEPRTYDSSRSSPRNGRQAGGTQNFASLVREQIEPRSGSVEVAEATSLRTRRTPFDVPPMAGDARDAVAREGQSPGAGLVTSSGAPKIVLNSAPACSFEIYSGPAVFNPYYSTPASPLRVDNVAGFDKWFQSIQIEGPGGFTWPKAHSATAEGAQEALRLVQQYVPGARVEKHTYGSQLGSTPSHSIVLPNGERMNAGLILDAYYHQGYGVDWLSDAALRTEIEVLTGLRPVEAMLDPGSPSNV